MADDRYTLSYTGEQVDELLGKIDNLGAATQSTDGLMSSEDKAKVDGIENGAQENVIESVTLNGVAQQVLNKAVNIVLDGATYMGIVYQDGGSSTPPTQKVFYLTGENGTYTNFNNIVVNDGEVAFLCWTGAAWVKEPIVTKDLIEDFGHTFYEDQTLGAGASLKVGSWSNIKLSSTGGQTIAEYIASQIEVIKQFTYTVADSLPTASADTMYIIYLVPSPNPQSQNARDEFITVRSGSEGSYTYAWEQIGSTEMDLSDYAKKDEIQTFAGNLVDTRSAGTAQEFTRRKSGGDGVGYMTRIKGNSIVWNQLVDLSLGTHIHSTVAANGLITITATVAASSNQFETFGNLSLIGGHKYLMRFQKISGDATGTLAYFGPSTQSVADGGGDAIYTQGSSSSVSSFVIMLRNTTAESKTYNFTCYIQLFDLTASTLSVTSVSDFTKFYNLPYYAPNPGAIKNNCATGMVTDGLNQIDTSNAEFGSYNTGTGALVDSTSVVRCWMPIVGGQTYYINVSSGLRQDSNGVGWYDAARNYLGNAYYNTNIITAPASAAFGLAVLRAVSGTITPDMVKQSTLCINLSGARNGQYEPHWSDTTALPITTATGKLNGEGESVVLCPEGARSAGSAYDEFVIEKGFITKFIKRIGVVDLGTLTWSNSTPANSIFRTFFDEIPDIKPTPNTASLANAISAGYTQKTYTALQQSDNLCFCVSDAVNSKVVFINQAYTDVDTFKTAMSGVMMNYELATPKLYILDTPVPVTYQVDKDGTETVTTPEGTAPTSAPFKADTNYSISVGNLVRALEALQNA